MSLSRMRLPLSRLIRICTSYTGSVCSGFQKLDLHTLAPQYLQSSNKLISGKQLGVRMYAETSPIIFEVENDEEFSSNVIESPVPVLVDFYADWCGPCRMLGPRLEAKVKGLEGALLLAKVDVDCAADLAMQYEVNAVPTIIAFKNGEVVARMEGDQGDDYLEELIKSFLQ